MLLFRSFNMSEMYKMRLCIQRVAVETFSL